MRLLAVGDVCGPVGCERIKQSLPVLKREKKIDVAVVNGENSVKRRPAVCLRRRCYNGR